MKRLVALFLVVLVLVGWFIFSTVTTTDNKTSAAEPVQLENIDKVSN